MSSRKKLPDNQITLYQTSDGKINIEVLYAHENIWLPQKGMAELFDCTTDNISLHLKNIYKEKELDENLTTEEFSVVKLREYEILNNAGAISREVAQALALKEYEVYKKEQDHLFESDLDRYIKQLLEPEQGGYDE